MFSLRKLLQPNPLISVLRKSKIASNIKELEKSLFTHLKSEIDGEVPDLEREKFLSDYLTQNKWHMEEHDDSTRLVLSKKANGHFIKVYYEAKLPENANENQEEEEQKEEEGQTNNYTEFLVVVDKNQPKKLLLEVIAMEGEVTLNAMVFSEEAEALAEKKPVSSSPYNGPAFETLDEKLQEKISKYVAGLGIDEELAHFVEESAIHHEAKMYRNFLNDFKHFIE